MSIKVLLVDDHPVFMAGIRAVLEAKQGISIEGEAKDGNQAVKLVNDIKPDVVVMDITMPNLNGIEATKEILNLNLKTKVLALSIHSGKRFVKNMLSAGAVGYLLKESAPEELVRAIHKVAKGEMYLSSSITSVALSNSISEYQEIEILSTKLIKPKVGSETVYRRKIIELLEGNNNKPLSVVTAPAGYGKSTVVSQWINHQNAPGVWISLDDEHNNFRVFLSYFKFVLEKLFPESFVNFSKLLRNSELPSKQVLMHALINELELLDNKFVLVLDNYHFIIEPRIHEFIEDLLRFPTDSMHIVLVGRVEPAVNLSSLRVNNKMGEIGIEELSFSQIEIKEFFSNYLEMHLSDEATKSLYKKTEGWIAGVRIASMSISQTHDTKDLLEELNGDMHLVSEFLSDEILSGLDAKFRILLFSSSIVNHFCEELLDEIFSIHNSTIKEPIHGRDFIEKLRALNLFVLPLDSNRKWVRYHNQFHDLLHKKLIRNTSEDERMALHRLACGWFEKNNLVEDAIGQTIRANDTERMIQIIELNARRMIDQNKWHVLNGWLREVPNEIIYSRPELLLAKAWVHMFNFEVEALSPIMDRIDVLMKNGSDQHDLSGEVAYFRAHSSIQQFQDGNKSLEYLKRALHLISSKETAFRGESELLYGLAGQMEGLSNEVVKQINKWLADSVFLAPFRETRLLVVLKLIHYMELKIFNIENYLDRSRKITERNDLYEANAWCDYIDGLIHLQSGNLNTAIVLLERVKEKRFLFHARGSVDALVALALAYELKGKSTEANNTVMILEDYADSMGSLFIEFVNSCKSRLAILRGSPDFAYAWINNSSCRPVSAMLFWFEINCLTRCRILIKSGSVKNLKEASKIIVEYEEKIKMHHNRVNEINILALKSVLLNKQDQVENALEVLVSALILAETSNFILPFIELGDDMHTLMTKLTAEVKKKKNIGNFLSNINLKSKEWPGVQEKVSLKTEIPLKRTAKKLTVREIAVLNYVSRGMMNKEIAEAMFVSGDTIKKHLYNMFQKMEVKNRLSLVSKARKLGII